MANWSDLPDDIIALYTKQLVPYIEDFARFSCVCKSWRSSAINQKQQKGNPHCAPWLMITKKEDVEKINENNEEGIQSFYGVSSKRVYNMTLPTPGRKCWGTPYGWLFTIGLDLNISLFNPLSCAQISLPPQPLLPVQYDEDIDPEDLRRNFVVKMALAPLIPDKPDQCPLVMSIYGEICYLAIASPGDESWTSVEGPLGDNISDIVFFDGHFYVVDHDGVVGICDVKAAPPVALRFASPPNGVDYICDYYLIEVNGCLHFVGRDLSYYSEDEYGEEEEDDDDDDEDEDEGNEENDNDEANEEANKDSDSDEEEHGDTISLDSLHETSYFVVFKLNIHTKEWTEVEDLGDHALFVGNNQSFAISTADYPEFRSNCIYFTDDYTEYYKDGHCDMGIYDISEGTVTPFYISKDEQSQFSRPLFFIPTPP